ncbi:hypothetical protein SERLADRAFT_448847 [Serpula lacrymans var. lacrymans S7.9]|uniref:Uncharacterized protein n=1 Tax=Serpula lacrymans var. lacrymans (strain S7.9) TaxID=578457 RepID=F8NUY9_SERL9|nr:uncharacterized protein SERLADRAFT_448847 [Serpula lacrymans var. lacrymans S7.9]EGO25944.1 hypothetical protein SERLADRAFT_448847 [Serpula lacrymans var. lacrymans S7.9]
MLYDIQQPTVNNSPIINGRVHAAITNLAGLLADSQAHTCPSNSEVRGPRKLKVFSSIYSTTLQTF